MTGQEIRTARIALGLTQQQLAEKAGVSQGLVSAMERGLTHADHTVRQWKVREVLGLTNTRAPRTPEIDITDRIKDAQEKALSLARTAAQQGDYQKATALVEQIVIEGDALLVQADDLAQRIRAKARELGLEGVLDGSD